MASSHDATGPCDHSQGLVPSCVPTLKIAEEHEAKSTLFFEEYEFSFSVLLLGSHKWIKYF